jgi:hypothetical protein
MAARGEGEHMSYSTHNSLPVNSRRVFAKLALAASIAAAFVAAPAADEVAAQGPPPPPGSVGGDWGGPPPPPPGTGGGDWNGPPPPPPGTGGPGDPTGMPTIDVPAPAPRPVTPAPVAPRDTVKPSLRISSNGSGRRVRIKVVSSEAARGKLVLHRVGRGSKRTIVRHFTLRAGTTRISLRVAPGRYRATLTAIDTAGNAAAAHGRLSRR